MTDAQIGFCPCLGTRDAFFALHSIITNLLLNKKKFYCCVIDFCCAFDSINRSYLFYKISKLGIQGKLIKSMYNNVKSCVTVDGFYSQHSRNNICLMQGE